VKSQYRLARYIGHLSWLRLGIRRRLVRALAPQERVASAAFDTTHFAGRYRGDIANAQEWHVYFFGGYELKELSLMTDILGQMNGPVALDIGGNLGGHALTMARVAKNVHTVEPFPPLADRIDSLMKMNGCDNVVIHRIGLGAEVSELDYYLDTESRNQGTGSFLNDHSDGGVAAKLKVVRGDEHFQGTLDALDFIKIDIEGFEAPALSGLRNTLEKFRPIIMMEVTESSARLFEEFGGIEKVMPFEFDLWKINNPSYPLGIFESGNYSIAPIDKLDAGKASFNILIVPKNRAGELERFRKG